MLHPLVPRPVVHEAIWPRDLPVPVLQVVQKLPLVHPSVLPLVPPLPALLVVQELTDKLAARRVVRALPLDVVVVELSLVAGAIVPGVGADSLFLAFAVLPAELRPV